jgi:hypothetical protein
LRTTAIIRAPVMGRSHHFAAPAREGDIARPATGRAYTSSFRDQMGSETLPGNRVVGYIGRKSTADDPKAVDVDGIAVEAYVHACLRAMTRERRHLEALERKLFVEVRWLEDNYRDVQTGRGFDEMTELCRNLASAHSWVQQALGLTDEALRKLKEGDQ